MVAVVIPTCSRDMNTECVKKLRQLTEVSTGACLDALNPEVDISEHDSDPASLKCALALRDPRKEFA